MKEGFKYNDGGRSKYFRASEVGDCVTRSIAIAAEIDYKEVYDGLREISGESPRDGVKRKTYQTYLESLGWTWVPTMKIGSGCKVHLIAEELPKGRLIVRVSKHITTMIDGIIHDIYDPRRETHSSRPNDGLPLKQNEWLNSANNLICSVHRRCVYGYFIKQCSK